MAEGIPTRHRVQPGRPSRVPDVPPAPAHLSDRSKALWRDGNARYVLGLDGEILLRAGLESLDTFDEAHEILRREGLTIRTKTGSRPHPAIAIARQALTSCRACFRQLGLTPPEV
jgi:P27 family predicted phage terminase small subunit